MFIFTYRFICPSLMVIAVCLGASVAACADRIVPQTNFQSPTNLGIGGIGSDMGGPDSFRVTNGVASVVANPCVLAKGTGQCLQLIGVGT